MSSASLVFAWLVRVLVALIFIMAAYGKLTSAPAMVGLFEIINIGQWFRYVTGILELMAAIFLLIPALTIFGALLIVGIMAGAVATHLFIIGGSFTLPLALLLTSMLELYLSRRQIRKAIYKLKRTVKVEYPE
jgi:uncharacterized membrane protein YphA (DoxX/SURF4 family)